MSLLYAALVDKKKKNYRATTPCCCCRFYDPDGGSIFLGDRDLLTYGAVDISKAVSWVTQEPQLFPISGRYCCCIVHFVGGIGWRLTPQVCIQQCSYCLMCVCVRFFCFDVVPVAWLK